jgi:two-component system, OmpR family, KDP operon response regulator KdpE
VKGQSVTKVLVIDDEVPFARALGISLRARGYQVEIAASGEVALDVAARARPDVILLDLGLPGIDGVEVLRGLRAWSTIPVIVLSARHDERTKVAALDAGADDYVTKPFGMDELLARLRAAIRRVLPPTEEPIVTTDTFAIDLGTMKVTNRSGADIRLTPTEWRIVELLVRSSGKLVTQRQVLQQVWGPQYVTETYYLRTYLAGIRRKLEPNPSRPRHFITEPGMGYRFEP